MGTGKNPAEDPRQYYTRKHPRGDGEELTGWSIRPVEVETPPWGRGRKCLLAAGITQSRNTPVGTGKKEETKMADTKFEKHPRGDGEENAFELS